MRSALLLLGVLCGAPWARAQAQQEPPKQRLANSAPRPAPPLRGWAAPAPPAQEPADTAEEDGLRLFRQQQYAAAAPLLERAHERHPRDAELSLLLGICRHRLGQRRRALRHLRAAVRDGDREVQAEARIFLGLIYQAQGAEDLALAELHRSIVPGEGGQRLAAESAGALLPRQHRLHLSLLVSPEYDGNVPLTDYGSWSAQLSGPQDASQDGDVLFLGSASLRPFRRVGLVVGDSLLYRQQLRLGSYNLLQNATWVGYSFLGDANRVRLTTTFTYAMLGGATLFLDYDQKVWYRRRMWRGLGVLLSYDGRYRDYWHTSYLPFTGQTHALGAELSWGDAPAPIAASVGVQGLREELAQPAPGSTAPDFRAWAYGPLLRLRAQVHRRAELGLTGLVLQRRFDSPQRSGAPSVGDGRLDWDTMWDLSLSVTCTPWLDIFLGGTIIYNQSSDPLYTYIKPAAYLGLGAHYGAF